MDRVTLQTIADHVGVSRATVSNAFSRPDQLSDALRKRIMRAAGTLGYVGPDPIARSLRSGRVGALGVLLTESLRYALRDPYSSEFLVGISDTVTAAGSGLLLVPLPPATGAIDAVRNAAVDGFIALALPDDHPAIASVLARRVPFVTVDGPRLDGTPFVGIDDHAAATEVTELVLSRGHRVVAVLTFRVSDDDHIGGVDESRLAASTYSLTRRRLGGVLAALRAHDLDPADVTVIDVGPNDDAHTRAAMSDLMSRRRPPTAVIALSDRTALAVLRWARSARLEVPGDLSVSGFDDIPAASEYGLTTVHQPAHAKGAAAARLLTDPNPPAATLLSHEILVRSTVGPVRRPLSG